MTTARGSMMISMMIITDRTINESADWLRIQAISPLVLFSIFGFFISSIWLKDDLSWIAWRGVLTKDPDLWSRLGQGLCIYFWKSKYLNGLE